MAICGPEYMRPSALRYSQTSILNTFQDGTKIGDLLDDLCFGRCFPSALKPMDVAKVNGQWYSADNRRLWVLKHLEMLGRVNTVPVKVKKRIFHGKLTTKNEGETVKIRGGDPGGSVYAAIQTILHNKENREPTKKKRKRRRKKKKCKKQAQESEGKSSNDTNTACIRDNIQGNLTNNHSADVAVKTLSLVTPDRPVQIESSEETGSEGECVSETLNDLDRIQNVLRVDVEGKRTDVTETIDCPEVNRRMLENFKQYENIGSDGVDSSATELSTYAYDADEDHTNGPQFAIDSNSHANSPSKDCKLDEHVGVTKYTREQFMAHMYNRKNSHIEIDNNTQTNVLGEQRVAFGNRQIDRRTPVRHKSFNSDATKISTAHSHNSLEVLVSNRNMSPYHTDLRNPFDLPDSSWIQFDKTAKVRLDSPSNTVFFRRPGFHVDIPDEKQSGVWIKNDGYLSSDVVDKTYHTKDIAPSKESLRDTYDWKHSAKSDNISHIAGVAHLPRTDREHDGLSLGLPLESLSKPESTDTGTSKTGWFLGKLFNKFVGFFSSSFEENMQ